MTNKILVTGGLGYIGSHMVLQLIEFGYTVIIIDKLINSSIEVLTNIKKYTNNNTIEFYNIDLCNQSELDNIFLLNKNIYAVIHFAALKSIPDSIQNPHVYYHNNVVSTTNLINSMKKYNCYNLIFSSSACIYGDNTIPYNENMPIGKGITNPYGMTKYICEEIIKNKCKINNNFNAIILRYFNPVGNHSSGLFGDNINSTNLMSNIIKSIKSKKSLCIYGNKYNTKDGTCIRDFIHIDDLVYSHIICLKNLTTLDNYKIYNVGSGTGYTVLELITQMSYFFNINYTMDKERIWDIPIVYADISKIKNELGWYPKKTLYDICIDTMNYIQMSVLEYK